MTGSAGRLLAGRIVTVVATLLTLGLAAEASAQCCAPKSGADSKGASAQCAAGSCVVLNIGGMTCKDCAPKVEKALSDVKGVKSVKVSYDKGEATVELGKSGPKAKQLIKAVMRAGFDAQVKAAPADAPGKPTNGSTQGSSKS